MLGSFLSSLKEKSGADKRCRANLPAVRLQGQARDKTWATDKAGDPYSRTTSCEGWGGGDARTWYKMKGRGSGAPEAKAPRKLITPTAPRHHLQRPLTFCSPSSSGLVGDHNKLSRRFVCQQTGLSRNIMSEKSSWQEHNMIVKKEIARQWISRVFLSQIFF